MKYRIIEKNNQYFPQMKWFGLIWKSIEYEEVAYPTMEHAYNQIEEHKRIFSKENKKIVWEGEL